MGSRQLRSYWPGSAVSSLFWIGFKLTDMVIILRQIRDKINADNH